jgi:DNA-binding XRE family transcriptional regulator
MREIKWNDKVSKSRGKDWKKKLVQGRLDAALNPTKLKLARVKANLSQEAVAKQAGLSLATYGAIERSKRPLRAEAAQKISKVLKTPLTRLFQDTVKGKFIAQK